MSHKPMNTLTSAPCTSRTSPKNKEPRLARDRRGKLGWRGIDEPGTHTCARKGKSQWEGRDGVSIYADFSSFDRSSTHRSSWRIFVLGTREKKKERNKNIAIQVKKLTTKKMLVFYSMGRKESTRGRVDLCSLLNANRYGIGISREMKVLRRETTGSGSALSLRYN